MCRVGIHMRAGPSILLAPSRNPRHSRRLVPQVRLLAPLSRSTRFLLSRSSDTAPPDFLLLCTRYARICPSLLSPAIVPPDFFYGETDRGVIYRACSWLPEPPGDLAFWDWHAGEGRKVRGRWMDAGRNDWSVYLWDLLRSLVLIASRIRYTRLFAISHFVTI